MMKTHCNSPDRSGQAGPDHADAQDDAVGSGHGRVRRRDQDTQAQLKSLQQVTHVSVSSKSTSEGLFLQTWTHEPVHRRGLEASSSSNNDVNRI